MLVRLVRFSAQTAVVFLVCASVLARAGQAHSAAQPVVLHDLGKGVVALEGPWQFHLGDNPAWASQTFDDSAWEQLTADRPWGTQGHANYSGFAWYRRRIDMPAAGAVRLPIALLIPHIDNAYQVYWNGSLIGADGKLPPQPIYYEMSSPPRIFHFQPVTQGVLALRVWKAPPLSDDPGIRGGFNAVPLAGEEDALANRLAATNYQWLDAQQFYFGVTVLYGLVALLSLLAWLQDRKQWPLFWMFGFALAPVIELVFYGAHIHWPAPLANALWQPIASLRDICLWYLLLWLLDLRDSRRLLRITAICCWVNIASQLLDSAPYFLAWIPAWRAPMQILDAVATACWIPTGILPLLLVAAAVLRRRRLDNARGALAIFAFFAGMMQLARSLAPQGSRFTHWTLADRMEAPLFTWNGNSISAPTLTSTLLLVAIVYAVYRSFDEARRNQSALEEDFRNAGELQRVLIPDELPAVPGYAVTSAYLPAQQVGGDFFQIIPLEGAAAGSTLVAVGDVSGKGLKAAMAVSFIVGALRALAGVIPYPGQLLAELNNKLAGRLGSGFATCLILRLDAQGHCVMASAGHPPVFLNRDEVELPGAFPLGLFPDVGYQETALQLEVGDRCTLYTDGLLEARNKSGEIYGFDRLWELLRAGPDAPEAAAAAVRFGQDDDITVVTLTRTAPSLTRAPSRRVQPLLAPGRG